jgi:hypothetical protein
MAATITTLDAILKEFYVGPIQDQLNQEVLALELFEKAKLDWSGKQVIIPIHTARNSGVGARGEGDVLPTAGQQTFDRLVVTAKFVYGRFQITGPAISAAGKGGANSFASYVDAEMTRLVEDVRDFENQACFSGNEVIGFVVGPDNNAAATLNYDGSFAELERLNSAVALSAVNTVQIGLMNVSDGAGAQSAYDNESTINIDGFDTVNRTLSVAGGGGANLQNDGAGNGYGPGDSQSQLFAVRLTGTAVNAAHTALLQDIADEPSGLMRNLCSRTHFGVDRTSATGSRVLQIRDNARQPAAGYVAAGTGRGALALADMQKVIDDVRTSSGKEVEVILTHAQVRQSYVSLLQGTIEGSTAQGTGAKKLDAGVDVVSLGYAGIPMRVSRQALKGVMFFLCPSTWKMCQLEAPGFADLDGSVLQRTALGATGTDAFEGYYRHYYEIVAAQPNANGVLAGITV